MKKTIYLDHAATTPVDPRVFQAMRPFFIEKFGNPSSLYTAGMEANGAVNDSRRKIAEILHAMPDNIIFTSGGTESDNLAIFGVARSNPPSQGGTRGVLAKRHIITTQIEHHAILSPLHALEQQGWSITYLPVDKAGLVNPNDVIQAIRPQTVLISIMYANNEIGTVEPIAEIGKQLLHYRKENKTVYPYFHTDACQATGLLDLDVEKLHVDLMTINGSKIYGPKGIGALYVRRGVKIEPIIYGGQQERHVRAGTENVPGIVGLGKALELVQKNKDKESARLKKLAEYFINKLKLIPDCKLNGPELENNRLVNNVSVTFNGVEGEALVIYLNEKGIMCSTGSACNNNVSERSHVLKAIGLPEKEAASTIRFSMGQTTAKTDLDYTVKCLLEIINKLNASLRAK